MTNKEAIRILEVAKAEVEWCYPLSCQVAIDMAIEALKEPNCDRYYLVEQLHKKAEQAENCEVRKGILQAIEIIRGEE